MILTLKPIFQEKIWGGNNLKAIYHFQSPKNIGEAWIISGYDQQNSNLILGWNWRLDTFYQNNKDLFNNYPTSEFPLLVKLIDAQDDLSIQVHPNNQQAAEIERYPFGKYEAWIILATKKNNNIIIGTKIKDRKIIKTEIENANWDKIIKKHPIKTGDIFNIPPGTLHAIMSGTLIYEIQQSSDITYRFYDYDRKDQNGEKRPLHLEKSLLVLNPEFDIDQIENINDKHFAEEELLKNQFFSLNLWTIAEEEQIVSNRSKNFLLATVISGFGTINNHKISQYDSFIITADELTEPLFLKGKMQLLVANPN